MTEICNHFIKASCDASLSVLVTAPVESEPLFIIYKLNCKKKKKTFFSLDLYISKVLQDKTYEKNNKKHIPCLGMDFHRQPSINKKLQRLAEAAFYTKKITEIVSSGIP